MLPLRKNQLRESSWLKMVRLITLSMVDKRTGSAHKNKTDYCRVSLGPSRDRQLVAIGNVMSTFPSIFRVGVT